MMISYVERAGKIGRLQLFAEEPFRVQHEAAHEENLLFTDFGGFVWGAVVINWTNVRFGLGLRGHCALQENSFSNSTAPTLTLMRSSPEIDAIAATRLWKFLFLRLRQRQRSANAPPREISSPTSSKPG